MGHNLPYQLVLLVYEQSLISSVIVKREKYGRSRENRLRVSPLFKRMSLACRSQFLLYELLVKKKAIWGYELRPAENLTGRFVHTGPFNASTRLRWFRGNRTWPEPKKKVLESQKQKCENNKTQTTLNPSMEWPYLGFPVHLQRHKRWNSGRCKLNRPRERNILRVLVWGSVKGTQGWWGGWT